MLNLRTQALVVALGRHQTRFQSQLVLELLWDTSPVLDQEIDELRSVNQTNTRETRFQGDIMCSFLEASSCDESALTIRGDGLPELLHHACGYLVPQGVALHLHKEFYRRQIGQIQDPLGVHATVSLFPCVLSALKSYCRE